MEELFAVNYPYLIPLLPLLGAAIAGFACTGSRKRFAHWPIWLGVLSSALISFSLLFGMLADSEHGTSAILWTGYQWITAGSLDVPVQFLLDPLTAVMLCVVTGVGFLITVFAAGYMKGEEGYSRFFAYLGLFIFMMTVLVMGNNFLLLYLGWEGVGLCSYLLIGYYYEKPAARDAAKKAFLVNRIGDFGFGLGIMLTFLIFGSVSFFNGNFHGGVLAMAADPGFIAGLKPWQQEGIKWIPFLLMLGAFGKSAQFPLYVWLPDAMEGPTPVSALIHAATMVTAGVYMIARCGTLFVQNEAAMWTIAIVGAFTALFSATIALRQFDLKKVFAYSTISQLGFMFVGVGVLAPVAGVFHLVTHAFFKALLFLSSGVVMHAMLGHLDMRQMSGLRRILPWTRWLMLIGCAALAGVPFLSGFFSKDEIVAAAFEHNPLLGIVMLLTALLTAFYTFRLYFRVFEGPLVQPEAAHESHGAANHAHAGHGAHEPNGRDAEEAHAEEHAGHNPEPWLMIAPLVLLAAGALFAGYLNTHHQLGVFLGKSPSFELAYRVAINTHNAAAISPEAFGQHDVKRAISITKAQEQFHTQMMIYSGFIAIIGIGLAFLLHLKNRKLADRLAQRFAGAARLLEHKYWVDEIYQAAIVNPLRMVGQAMFLFDRMVIDGIVWAFGFIPQGSGFVVKLTTQRGQLQGYALTMLIGIVIIIVAIMAS